MKPRRRPARAALSRTIAELEARCLEAEETLAAIRSGEVDALVVEGPQGAHVYSLQGAQESYRVMVERMQEGAATLRADGVVLYANDRLAAMLRVPLERLTGQPLETFVVPAERPAFRTLLGEGDVRLESTFVAYDGTVIPVYLAAAALPVGPSGTVCLVVTDLTLRKQTEAITLADRRKSDFIAMLSHELRNPLGPLLHAAHVIAHAIPDDARLRRAQEVIVRQVRHMAKIVDDLLEVSRIDRGKILLRAEPTDLARLVRTTIDDHRVAIDAKRLSLVVDVPDTPVWTVVDPTRIAQVVGNLVHNAVKFTDAGGIEVRLAVDEREHRATLTVRDSGVGMDAATLGSIFDSFSQADRTLDRTRGGLGLGLALVKGLVELHGGDVSATSDGLERGSRFEVRIPVDRTARPGATELSWQRSSRTYRVLIIEDNADAAESLRAVLEASGHTVAVASTGVAGITIARAFAPEVVLCDIGLPDGLDGYEVARALRAEPSLESCRLVALTGYGRRQDRRLALEAGFHLHVVKPVDVSDLELLLRGEGEHGSCADVA